MTDAPGGGRSVDRIDTATERTPLLAGTVTPLGRSPSSPLGEAAVTPGTINGNGAWIAREEGEEEEEEDAEDPAADPLASARALLRPRVVFLALALVFLLELSIGMSVPPTNAVMESIICRQMHPEVFGPAPVRGITSHGIVLADDPACKAPDVQGYLAMLRGWQNTFECLPGIVGAVPYGVLSDRWGRRPVLALGVFGIVLALAFTYVVFFFSEIVPLWTVCFAAVFELIGGSGVVVVAMVYTAVADVVPTSGRATVFFQLSAVFLGSQMIAGPIGGAMLVLSPWLPLLVALAVLTLTNLAVLAVPETVHLHERKGRLEREDTDGSGDPGDGGVSTLTKLLRNARAGVIDVWDFVLANTSLAFLMASFVFTILGRFVGELLLQYSTDRYYWSWSFASLVLTILNAGSMLTLLVALPVASHLCVQRFGMPAVAKDIWLARLSGIILVIGSLVVAAAANGVLFSFGLALLAPGAGITALIRSLLNALVEEHHVGTVNSLIGFAEQVGLTIAGPLLAKSLSVGLNLGGPWIGLPFFGASVSYALSTAILWGFRLPKPKPSSTGP